jgi:hypothetical protein
VGIFAYCAHHLQAYREHVSPVLHTQEEGTWEVVCQALEAGLRLLAMWSLRSQILRSRSGKWGWASDMHILLTLQILPRGGVQLDEN